MPDYPNDIFVQRELENLPGITYDPADKKTLFAEDMQALGAEVTAIEATLGTNPQGSIATTVKERISNLESLVSSYSFFLAPAGRLTLPHDSAFNLSTFALVFEASSCFGQTTFLLGKGDITDTFYIRVLINTAGDIVASMRNSAQTITAIASGVLVDFSLKRVKLTYDDSGDRKLRIFVDDELEATSTAFTTVPLIFNSDDFILDMGAGAQYITRFGLSSNLDWSPSFSDFALDEDVVFFFPASDLSDPFASVVGDFDLTPNSYADIRPVPGRLLPVDILLRGLLNLFTTQIGSRFWWDKDDAGPAGIGHTILDWEGSPWLSFFSEEDGEPQTTGDANFQTKQRLAGGAIFGAPARLKAYVVASLPAGVQGDLALATNALSPVSGSPVVGGGSVVIPVFYNGTNWVVV